MSNLLSKDTHTSSGTSLEGTYAPLRLHSQRFKTQLENYKILNNQKTNYEKLQQELWGWRYLATADTAENYNVQAVT